MKKKKKSFPKKPALVLTAAALLLVGSTVGSTRAALTYYSENYSAQMNMQSIGVSLLENDKVVSSRDYVSNNEWKGTSEGTLLTNLLGKDETFTPGKKYNEAISVKNSGTIDTFVRVIITKSWQDEKGNKTITYTYKYNGYTFHIDAEVDAVQTHNAKDAIKSAWGVDVNVSDDETTMSLQ